MQALLIPYAERAYSYSFDCDEMTFLKETRRTKRNLKSGPARIRALMAGIACLLMSGCGVPSGAEMWLQVKRYSGDGKIYTCSNVFGPGYGIDFPPFDASVAYSNSYRLSRVPQVYRLEGKIDPVIYLRFQIQKSLGNSDEIKRDTTASFEIILSKSNGEVIHSSTLPLSTSTWTVSQGLVGVYDVEKSKLHLNRDSSYVLRVVYTPGRNPPPVKQLHFAIDDCAFY